MLPPHCLKLHFLFAAKQFLIAGGLTNRGGNDLATEVIDVQSNSKVTSSFREIPSRRRDNAMGGALAVGALALLLG